MATVNRLPGPTSSLTSTALTARCCSQRRSTTIREMPPCNYPLVTLSAVDLSAVEFAQYLASKYGVSIAIEDPWQTVSGKAGVVGSAWRIAHRRSVPAMFG